MIRILGIDPGSRKAGFGLIEKNNGQIKYLTSGTLSYDSKSNFLDRLSFIYESCQELETLYHPDEIAIESLVFVKNISSLAKLAQARGAMIAAFTKSYRGKIFEYSPTMVKASLTGHGHADKEGIQKGLRMMFGPKIFKTSDESDALAIAVCHSLMKNQRSLSLLKQP